MSILGGIISCHAPILIPEIGKGECGKAEKTIEGLKKAFHLAGKLEPETVILVSPHMEGYLDAFKIEGGEKGRGDFSRFSFPDVKVGPYSYDLELAKKIQEEAGKEGIAANLEEDEEGDFGQDHGSMVPLYFLDHSFYRSYKLVRISVSGLSYPSHYRMGIAIRKAVDALDRKVLILSSGDLSHCQKEDGPYGYKSCGPLYDSRIMKTLAGCDFKELLSYDKEAVRKAEVCGHPSFCVLAGCFDGYGVKATAYSHEAPFGIGYGVLSFLREDKKDERCFLGTEKKEETKDPYVSLARRTIESYIGENKILSSSGLIDEMVNRKAGAFVSIKEDNELRGCIGTISPFRKNLGEEIIANAISASTRDPRFSPIRKNELPFLKISVDVLSPLESVQDKTFLDSKKYGVVVKSGDRRGLLLPDLEGVDTVEEQISIALKKAGILEEEPYELFRFTVERHR